MTFGIEHGLITILQHGDLVFRINLADEEGIVEILRAQVLQRLLRIRRFEIVASNHESILRRNPEFEFLAVAHHVESAITNNG